MKRNMAIIGLLVVFLMMAANAFSWQNRCNARNGYGFCQGILNLEGLTDEQRTEITGLQQAFFDDTNPLRETLRLKKGELRTLLGQVPIDTEQASGKQKEIFAISQEIQEKSLTFRMAVLEKLTPDQAASINSSGCRKMTCPKMANCPKSTGMCRGAGCGMGNGMGGCCARTQCPAL